MTGIIHLENILKSYFLGKQELPVLKGINLDIFKNEYVALMGPSGSGKSTLMNILGCLDSPTGGSYILNGKDVSRMPDNDLAEVRNKEIGFVFQQFNLLPRLTAAENVALPLVYSGCSKKERVQRALDVLEKVKLQDRSHHKPNELSGGQCQRVAIARALINNPSIILADEPTGNLDTKTSNEIMDIFGDIHNAGNTVILVTHEEDISTYAHRIIRLRDGVIESDKTRAVTIKS
ncbi:MAG: ABC transporter ATP-binding protein [Ferruginibacter sp.]